MNTNFIVNDVCLSGAKVITPFYVEDDRGYFLKSFEKDIFQKFEIDIDVFESFETYSKKSVIRGLHFQTKNPQAKLIRVIAGSINDVIVDLRENSKTFGQWEVFQLSDENRKQLWIPKGFAHGFCVTSSYAIVSYTCTGKYEIKYDTGIVWDDPELAIPWEISNPIVSLRDLKLMSFKEYRKSLHV